MWYTYVNDLPDCIQHSTIRPFADSCILHRPIQSESDAILLQEDINSLFTWTIIWQMELNIDKCCSMSVTLSRLHNFSCSYHIQNSLPIAVTHCKYLGVIIQSDLRWDMHINQITVKANHTLSLLQRNIKLAPTKTKELLYKSLVRPQLEYASTVWSPWQNTLINSVEKIQCRAACYVTNNYNPYSSGTQLLTALNWEPLEVRRINSRLCKMIHNYMAIPFNLYIQPSSSNNTRHSNDQKFLPLSCNKNSYRQSFFPNTILDWNRLTTDVANSSSLDQFKSNLVIYNL